VKKRSYKNPIDGTLASDFEEAIKADQAHRRSRGQKVAEKGGPGKKVGGTRKSKKAGRRTLTTDNY